MSGAPLVFDEWSGWWWVGADDDVFLRTDDVACPPVQYLLDNTDPHGMAFTTAGHLFDRGQTNLNNYYESIVIVVIFIFYLYISVTFWIVILTSIFSFQDPTCKNNS